MIQRPLSLALTLLLALSTAAPAVEVESAGPKGGAAVNAAAATPAAANLPSLGVTPGLSAPALPAAAQLTAAAAALEAGAPEAVRALAARENPAAAVAAALAAQPALIGDSAVHAEAQKALGEAGAARLEAAAAVLARRAQTEPAVAEAVAALREKTSSFSPAKTRETLTRMIKAFGVMQSEAPAVAGAESTSRGPSLPKSSRRLSRARSLIAGVVMAASMLSPMAVHAQTPSSLPMPNPIVALAQANVRQGDYVRARDINDAIRQARPDVNVIVVGDVALDAGTLKAIAAELNGKPWTVVIVNDAQGHVYTDAEGRTHYDLDAVDFGTGQGIYNKGGMGDAVNAQTGERSRVVLTIVMRQHKLFLHGSEAMRAHGLDVDSGRPFKGDLDQWAISNMRNGGDVLGAVRETVSNIDALLTQSIAADSANGKQAVADAKSAVEELARAQASFSSKHAAAAASVAGADIAALRRSVAEGERLLAAGKPRQANKAVSQTLSQARSKLSRIQSFDASFADGASKLANAGAEVDALDKAAASYRDGHRKAAGDLVSPATTKAMREKLAAARAALETDSQASAATAAEVTNQVRTLSQSLAELPAAADEIAAQQKLHDQLDGKLRSGEAHESLVAAQQALRQAQDDVQNGNSTWKADLDQAKTQLAASEQTIAAADAAARTKLILFWLFNILAGLLTLGGSIFLNRRAARAGAKAEVELKKWDDILEKKLDAIIDHLDQQMDVYVGTVSGEKSRGWVGETAEAAAKIRSNAGYAKLLLAKARQVHDESTALVRPKAMTWTWFVNMFWPSNYALAEGKLATEPITFKPEDGLDGVFGEKSKDWHDDLYGDVKDYQPFSKNFTELMAEFNNRSQTAVELLEGDEAKQVPGLVLAITKRDEVLNAVDGSINTSAKTRDSLANADGLFSAAALFTAALPAATALIATAREVVKTDPMKGVYGGGAEASRVVNDSNSLVTVIHDARESSLKSVDENNAALSKLSIGTDWIAAEKKRLSAESDAIASAAAKSAVGDRIAKLSESLGALSHKSSDALKGAQALDEALKAITAAKAAVESARAQLSAALDIPASQLMREADLDPSAYLAAADAAAEKTRALISAGKLDEAKASYDTLQQNLKKATGITAASLDSLKNQEAVQQARAAETERLKALVPHRQKVLESVEREFADSVLALTAGDASHPNANGTVSDNIEEADAAIGAAADKREKALKAFREGSVLKAADLLSQAKAHQEIAQYRLDEITEKRTRLDQAVAANAATLQALNARVKDYESKVVDDKRTMKDTLGEFAAAKTRLASAAAQAQAAKPDPFQAASGLAAVTAELDHVWVSARNDFDQHAELGRALSAARAQLDEAGRQAQRAKGDGVADSPAITRSYSDLANLESAYGSAVTASQKPHGDWPTLDHEAGRIGNEAAHVAGTLKDELAAAARATDAISSASSQVRQATNWTGGYGVYIPGSPGSGSLESARAALNRGDYQSAISYAGSARSEAANAIAVAEAEVLRLRREEEERRRREEEERRERERQEEERRNASSGGGSSGGGSDWGGSSSGNSSSGW